jgi:transcriptional regulator with XRE-family HTH domain
MVVIDRAELRRCRKLSGLNQAQLAKNADVSPSYISLIESGKRRTVSPGTFARLCTALAVGDREKLLASGSDAK